MKLKDMLTSKASNPHGSLAKEHFEAARLKNLKAREKSSHGRLQSKIVIAYHSRNIKLTKKLSFGGYIFKRGTTGGTLAPEALNMFPAELRAAFEKQIADRDTRLVHIQGQIFVIPKDYFSFIK